jgi:hypothetical protein
MLDDYQLPAIERASSFFKSNLGWTIEKLSPPDPHHQWIVMRTPRLPGHIGASALELVLACARGQR